MERSERQNQVSLRLKELVDNRFPARGRFGQLESASGIGANKWKNFFYGKQDATPEMVRFWCNGYPDDADWLVTGIEVPEQETFPFAARVPKRWEGQTVGDRLNWVISEWAAPSGEKLFSYLEEKSGGRIPAGEWARVVLRSAQPSVEMIALVCGYRPHFTEWVIRGRTSNKWQVDPTDQASVTHWVKLEREEWDRLEAGLTTLGQKGNDDQAG